MKTYIAILCLLMSSEIARADCFGICANNANVDKRIVACTEAEQHTTYPRILHWVQRELARALSERGEYDKAIGYYKRSLSSSPSDHVQIEMDELIERISNKSRVGSLE